MSDEKAAAEILITGRVQGVGFRAFCVETAQRLALDGYAMNLADGRVRVVAEGRRASIEALVQALETGPRLARVENATVTWHRARDEFRGFGVRHADDRR